MNSYSNWILHPVATNRLLLGMQRPRATVMTNRIPNLYTYLIKQPLTTPQPKQKQLQQQQRRRQQAPRNQHPSNPWVQGQRLNLSLSTNHMRTIPFPEVLSTKTAAKNVPPNFKAHRLKQMVVSIFIITNLPCTSRFKVTRSLKTVPG